MLHPLLVRRLATARAATDVGYPLPSLAAAQHACPHPTRCCAVATTARVALRASSSSTLHPHPSAAIAAASVATAAVAAADNASRADDASAVPSTVAADDAVHVHDLR